MCTSGRLRPNHEHHPLGGADDQATLGFEHASVPGRMPANRVPSSREPVRAHRVRRPPHHRATVGIEV